MVQIYCLRLEKGQRVFVCETFFNLLMGHGCLLSSFQAAGFSDGLLGALVQSPGTRCELLLQKLSALAGSDGKLRASIYRRLGAVPGTRCELLLRNSTPWLVMMANSERAYIVLKFALTRDVILDDVCEFRGCLLAKGHITTLLDRTEGGLDFSGTAEPRKDLRFMEGVEHRGHILDLDKQEFAAPLNTVIAQFASQSPFFSASNRMRFKLTGRFSHQELDDVSECAEQCLGALPDVIHNRRFKDESVASVSREDSSDSLNLYLGFDLGRALARWTIANPQWERSLSERLFKCWRCQSSDAYFGFSHCKASHLDAFDLFHGCRDWGDISFFGLLGQFELCHRFPCCNACYRTFSTSTDTTLVGNKSLRRESPVAETASDEPAQKRHYDGASVVRKS